VTLIQTVSNTQHNLRHLRLFLAVVDTNSVTKASALSHLSQPAVTQALAKIERSLKTTLFTRTPQGLFANAEGKALARRVRRTFDFLDPALAELSPRLKMVATTSQLEALVAVSEAGNFTLAARQLGLAQPTVHRAITQLEDEAGKPLFERTSYGIIASRAALALAQAARLAFTELVQAETDLAEARSEEKGRIVIGAMPLARSFLLPRAIAEFRKTRPKIAIRIVEGPYSDLLSGLRRGEIDFLIGALREPAPIGDVEQRFLFNDTLVVVSGSGHPLAQWQSVTIDELAAYPWVVAQHGTPIRQHFDALFDDRPHQPASIVESSSLILMRELLSCTDHLGCISVRQAQAEIARGLLKALPLDLCHTARPIGLTLRVNWAPTSAQEHFISLLDDRSLPEESDH
jgi:DNA-binding transcriptional LysR family regulator